MTYMLYVSRKIGILECRQGKYAKIVPKTILIENCVHNSTITFDLSCYIINILCIMYFWYMEKIIPRIETEFDSVTDTRSTGSF